MGNGQWAMGNGQWAMGIGLAVRSWGSPAWSICRHWAWGLGTKKRNITNYQLPITNYQLPITNAPCPLPHALVPIPHSL
ncbi:hypothetical protein PI95_012165 [Hassallia byssoidea VB512170]|uniref:Uncharacterized protein n=1 Tax=Hassallia byssoidea VB512170 TaxID=1304833 RepID=A0A846H9N1_9CYAN|nr:hypothetical protein [Hassalia byssoidea]NEU73300.1 hypothetical protein [Hassalia byssoidea VB512170]